MTPSTATGVYLAAFALSARHYSTVDPRRRPVSEVVRKRVADEEGGAGVEWALDPVTRRNRHAFYVNDPRRGSITAFSSANTADIFDFLMETEGLKLSETVERPCGEAGCSHSPRRARKACVIRARARVCTR